MPTPRKKPSLLIPILLLIFLLLLALVGWMLYTLWCDSQQVFHDVTLELGTDTVTIQDFLTPLGNPNRASFVTDPSTLDLSRVGRSSLTLKHGTQKAVVNLIVVDTTPPTAEFLPKYTANVTDSLPQAGALVAKVQDYSQVRVYYEDSPEIPENYSDVDVTVVVEDTSGNRTKGQCLLHFTGWLKESCTVELGQSLTPEMLLTNPDRDENLLNPQELKSISGTLGEHTLTVNTGSVSAQCLVTVTDTTPPTLTLQNVHCMPGKTPEISDFVVSSADLSGEPVIRFAEELPDPYAEGAHTITLEAADSSGNVTRAEAILWISGDFNPPTIQGADKELTVQKDSSPNLLEGVSAVDDTDGKCDVAVDTSGLDLSKAGSYTVTYSAIDKSGNVASCQRTIVVT